MKNIFLRGLISLSFSVALSLLAGQAWAVDPEVQYNQDVETSLRNAWQARGHSPITAPFVAFDIEKDGTIANLRVAKSSGDDKIDNDALEAVKSLAPFPAPPKPEIHVGTIFRPIDFGPYMRDLQHSIKSQWHPPKEYQSKRITVVFRVAANGEVSRLRIQDTSGIPEADESAMKAVTSAQPFAALPEGVVNPVDIQFTFDYNVWKNGAMIGATKLPSLVKVSPARASDKVPGQYETQLAVAIQRQVSTLQLPKSSAVSVLFSVSAQGSMQSVDVERSSGNTETDAACMKAIMNASPFRPLPATLSAPLKMRCSIESNPNVPAGK